MKQYKSAIDFRIAVLQRLKAISIERNIDIARLQRQLAYDRFLCRIFSQQNPDFILTLKGGHALELRFQNTRATRDLDLSLKTSFKEQTTFDIIIKDIQIRAELDLKDYFSFMVGESILDLDGAPYGGFRLPVECKLAEKKFLQFHLDIGLGDFLLTPIDYLSSENLLEFAGIESVKFQTISKEQHFAEKIHAYTLPRETPNSRCKDLIDLIILINDENLNLENLKKAIDGTFNRRKTHEMPNKLIPPPSFWEEPFNKMAEICNIKLSIKEAFHKLEIFIEKLKM